MKDVITDIKNTIKGAIRLRVYCLLFGMDGVIKHIATEFISILRKNKVPKDRYFVYLEFMVNYLGNAIIEELAKRKEINISEDKLRYFA